MFQNSSSADQHRIADLFSPNESSVVPPTPDSHGRYPQSARMSGELPDSFLFANPFFARDPQPRRAE